MTKETHILVLKMNFKKPGCIEQGSFQTSFIPSFQITRRVRLNLVQTQTEHRRKPWLYFHKENRIQVQMFSQQKKRKPFSRSLILFNHFTRFFLRRQYSFTHLPNRHSPPPPPIHSRVLRLLIVVASFLHLYLGQLNLTTATIIPNTVPFPFFKIEVYPITNEDLFTSKTQFLENDHIPGV